MSATDFKFFLDGQRSQGAKNWPDFSIVADFTTNTRTLSTTSLEFITADALRLNNRIAAGRMYEGVPLRIELGSDVLEFVLDSSRGEYSSDLVRLNARQKIGLDFLNDNAQFRFEYLASIGMLTNADYTPYWYVIGRYPKALEILIASLTIYSVVKELIQIIKEIISIIGATAGGTIGILETIIQAAALIIYLAALVLALIDLVKQLIDLLFPFVYVHNAMSIQRQIEIGCAYLGLGFSSSLLDSLPGICIAPEKNTPGKKLGLQLDEAGFFNGTLEDLIFFVCDMLSAEVRVIGKTVYIEQWTFFAGLSTYIVPKVYIESYQTNAAEIKSQFNLQYSYDPTNLYSYDAWKGTSVQVQRVIDPQIAQELNMLKGSEGVTILAQLPNVITKQTDLEKIMGALWNAFTSLTKGVSSALSAFSGGGGMKDMPKIPKTGSIGAHQQDTHFSSMPMVFIAGEDGKIDPNTSAIIGAIKLYDYHIIKSPVPNNRLAMGNQWEVHKDVVVPMYLSEFLELIQNNYAKFGGKQARIMKIDFNPFTNTAKLDLDVNRTFTTLIKENISIDGGKS